VPRFSKSAKTIDVAHEKSSEIFRILVTKGKAMNFLAGAKGKDGMEDDALLELALPTTTRRTKLGASSGMETRSFRPE